MPCEKGGPQADEDGIVEPMHASELRFRTLAEDAPVTIWMTEEDGRLSYLNRAGREFLGGAGVADGAEFCDRFLHPEDAAMLKERMSGPAPLPQNLSADVRVLRHDGVHRWLLVNGIMRVSEQGRYSGYIGVCVDVTEKYEAEEAHRRAVQVLEESSRLKSEFLANMSHEIRTPMNGIITMARSLLLTPLDDQQRDGLETVLFSAESLLRVLNDVLDFSKIEANKLELLQAPFSPVQVLEGAVRTMAAKASEKALSIKVLAAPDLPRAVVGDGQRLRQVLLNLLSNAIKFTDAGEVCLQLRKHEAGEGMCLLGVEIRDTGIGIAEAVLPRIFESFSQAESAPSRRFGGTGLGLAISKRLVEMMGGSISAKSKSGVGTVFNVVIPFALEESEMPRGLVSSTPMHELVSPGALHAVSLRAAASWLEERHCARITKGAVSAGPLRLLVAEDNRVNQRCARALLERMGHVAHMADNGAAAVDSIQSGENYDLVLMDIQMPIMDGYEATRRIRDLESCGGRRLPIIAMTAHALAGDRERCIASGMDGYLTKPIEAYALYAVLRSCGLALSFDPRRLSYISGDSGDLMREIVDVFVEEVGERIRDLEEIVSNGDGERVARLAHAIKGCASNLSANDLYQGAARLEALARERSDADEMRGEILRISGDFRVLSRDLRNHVSEDFGTQA